MFIKLGFAPYFARCLAPCVCCTLLCTLFCTLFCTCFVIVCTLCCTLFVYLASCYAPCVAPVFTCFAPSVAPYLCTVFALSLFAPYPAPSFAPCAHDFALCFHNLGPPNERTFPIPPLKHCGPFSIYVYIVEVG